MVRAILGLAGGDVVVVTPCANGTTAILVGDVSVKGMEGKEFANWLATVFGIACRSNASPSAILASLNSHMCNAFADPKRGLFASAFVCRWHPSQQCCVHASAGAEPPVLFNHLGQRQPFAESSGIVLGVDRNAAYSDVLSNVDVGDFVIVYTDGIVSARRINSRDRLDESGLVTAVSSGLNRRRIAYASDVLDHVDVLVENYEDDASLLVMLLSDG